MAEVYGISPLNGKRGIIGLFKLDFYGIIFIDRYRYKKSKRIGQKIKKGP
jgi:hypothetical protein